MDCWWGLTEPAPGQYDFTGYRELWLGGKKALERRCQLHVSCLCLVLLQRLLLSRVDLVKEFGFKLQVVTCFHAQGTSSSASRKTSSEAQVGASNAAEFGRFCCNHCTTQQSPGIPLPSWLLSTRDVWYKDANGSETFSYISLWADHVEIHGRTPVKMYSPSASSLAATSRSHTHHSSHSNRDSRSTLGRPKGDWMQHFRTFFASDLGATITEMMIGLGTDGELKYPSYENLVRHLFHSLLFKKNYLFVIFSFATSFCYHYGLLLMSLLFFLSPVDHY